MFGGGGGSTGGSLFGVEPGAGGGGGSSYVDPDATGSAINPGVHAGNGRVLISYPFSLSLSSSANQVTYPQTPTYTATITPPQSGGRAVFTADSVAIPGCDNLAVTNGVVTCTAPVLLPGTHQILVGYSGPQNVSSGSATLSQSVQGVKVATQTTLSSLSGAASVTGQPITLVATVQAQGAGLPAPSGNLGFQDVLGQSLGVATLHATGPGLAQATLTPNLAPTGTYTGVTAQFGGDTFNMASMSPPINLVRQAGSFLNDTTSGITYSGTWTYSTNRGDGDFQNDEHSTMANADSFGYTFTGAGIRVIGETNSAGGTDEVYVDGVDRGSISTISQNRLAQQVLYSLSGLSSGTHTIKVVKTSGGYFELDALAVLA